MTSFWIPRVASPDGTLGQAQGRKKRRNRRLRKNVWPSWKVSWSRTSIPSTMKPSWRTEEEEAAPVSEKRLKRELRAEAIRRLEEAARTEKDFRAVVEEWNKLDRNRERRERDHENLRGDVPLEYQAVPEPKLIPRWMNNPAYRQLMAGNFLDILFDCPYEMHNLTADPFISRMVEELSEERKDVLYFLSLRSVQHHPACRCPWAV